MFESDQTIAPRIAWQIFQQHHPIIEPLPETCPEEKKVKSKISSLKSQLKKRSSNNDG